MSCWGVQTGAPFFLQVPGTSQEYNHAMESHSRLLALLFGFVLVAGQSLRAQSSVVGERCNLSVFGFKDSKTFLDFNRDLRNAIEKRDVGALSILVQFSLRITDDGGSYFIHDATSLQGHLDEIFTPFIQRAILSATLDSIWCNYTGISYGEGSVWVNVTQNGYFVATVNLPETRTRTASQSPSVEIACHTDRRRVVIDSPKKGEPRFRS